MEHLVSGQRQYNLVLGLQCVWRHLDDRGVEMLGASAQSRCEVDQKHITFVGESSEDGCLGPDDLRKVALEAVGVKRNVTPYDDIVPLAVNVERRPLVDSDFNGRVDENIVVGGEQRARIIRRSVEATGDLPV